MLEASYLTNNTSLAQRRICMDKEVNPPASTEEKHQEPLPRSMTAIAAGIIIAVIGSIMGSNWDQGTTINLVGFGMLLAGIAIFVLGIFGTVVTTLKTRFDQRRTATGVTVGKPTVLFKSVWSIGVGMALGIIGYILGVSYAKETIVNYVGFGMLLVGIAFFVLGAFETARTSANIYMANKRANNMRGVLANKDFLRRARNFWRYLVATRGLYNITGVMIAMGLLFFGLWQLDLIVSGPVWWSGGGSGWSHPNGAYSEDYFQCFLWRTTVGEAYDTLFLLIFVSFIVLFVSVFLWRWRPEK